LYGFYKVKKIKKALPEINFIICNKDTYNRKKLNKVYSQCFCGLRLTSHDGLSNSVIELGLMGRQVIWNGNLPNAVHYKSIDDVIKIIKKLSKQRGNEPNMKMIEKIKKAINIKDDWLNTDFYNKKNVIKHKPISKTSNVINTFIKAPLYKATVIINTKKEKIKYLRAAIESYKNQINIDVQIIVSTIKDDPSIKIAEKYECDVCINDNYGIYYQLNNAIKLVKNDWYCYASGNDIAMPTKLFDEISTCIRMNKLICYSNFYRCDQNLNIINLASFHKYDFTKHLQGNFINDCAIIHKNILQKYTPFKNEWGNHAYWDFWLRIFKGEGDIFCFNSKFEWKYRITTMSRHILRSRNEEKQKLNKELAQKLINYHKNLM